MTGKGRTSGIAVAKAGKGNKSPVKGTQSIRHKWGPKHDSLVLIAGQRATAYQEEQQLCSFAPCLLASTSSEICLQKSSF
jgi:hypothetical protein